VRRDGQAGERKEPEEVRGRCWRKARSTTAPERKTKFTLGNGPIKTKEEEIGN